MIIQLGVIGYVFYQSYTGRAEVVKASRKGCDRSKLDRQDIVSFEQAQSDYIHKVTMAVSVKPDVKKAANVALTKFKSSILSLSKRATINCTQAFPKAGLLP